MKSRKGISAAIAEMILVIVAIAISIGVIGYLMGWFSFSTGQTEGIRVYPDSYIELNYLDNSVCAYVHVLVTYKPYIAIDHAYLDKYMSTNLYVISGSGNYTVNNNIIILYDGFKGWIKICFNSITPDQVSEDYPGKVEIGIITGDGQLYKAVLKVKIVK